MKKICVIGATSPLGSLLAERLAEAGHAVKATYRDHAAIPEEWSAYGAIEPIELELTKAVGVDLSAEIIVWLAHIDAGRSNSREPAANVAALGRVLESLPRSSVKKVVLVSSGGSVYGPASKLPIPEGHQRMPISSYGLAKREMEDTVTAFGRENGVATAILRPGNIYGFERPGRRTKGVVGAFLKALAVGGQFTLVHGGRTVRDMIHADDVCETIGLAIESGEEEIVWNVGTSVGTRIREVLELVAGTAGLRMPEMAEVDNYDTDVLENILSTERIRAVTGWTAKIGLEAGIKRTLLHWPLLSAVQRG